MVWFLYLVNWKPTLECRRIWWCAFGVIRAAAVMESVVIVVASQLRHAKDDVSGSRLFIWRPFIRPTKRIYRVESLYS